jgi:diguanylate cyclase (GGDEF)-like protein
MIPLSVVKDDERFDQAYWMPAAVVSPRDMEQRQVENIEDDGGGMQSPQEKSMTVRRIVQPGQPLALAPSLAHALQPIVDAQTGKVWAYEALLRGTETAGFDTIDDFFDDAHARGVILETELALYALAFAAFRRLPAHGHCKIFLNVDGRLFEHPGFEPEAVAEIADRMGVPRSSVCLELSEKHRSVIGPDVVRTVRKVRACGLRIALDDFGQGYSELKLLYESAPEFVKIDRFFISGIAASSRKRLFVTTVVNLAHVLGAKVIAEGVETEEEFLACVHLGCDLVQGWYIARPLRDLADLPARYPVPTTGAQPDLRDRTEALIAAALVEESPLHADTDIGDVLHRFRESPDVSVFPVVDSAGEPLGYVHERDFRIFAYANFGRELLANRALGRPLREFLVRAPVVEMTCNVEDLLAGLAHCEGADAVIVTRHLKYAGVLGSAALLRIVNEKRLMIAQDQNPLTHLPGNASINAYVGRQAERDAHLRVFCYFDFNHFKPFNDTYGYRHGDRALILFADILARRFDPRADFLGHIGGDDFFVGRVDGDPEEMARAAAAALEDFRIEVESFYEPEHRQAGYLIAQDRQGIEQMYPLLTCSAAILVAPAGRRMPDMDGFSKATADAKRASKLAPGGLVAFTLE